MGNVKTYQVGVYTGTAYTNYYSYSYARYDGYQESQVYGSSSYFQPGTTASSYDINGNLVSVSESFATSKSRSFVTDQAGHILQKTENGKTQNYFYANDKALGSSGALGTADFDYNYTPVSAQYPAATPGNYVVSAGDSLRSIALAVYGDAQLWYLIADANGLKTDADLQVGRNLSISNKVTNLRNAYDTFKPYAPGQIIGDTTPTLPEPPPPPAQSSDDGGCGGLGSIIVMAVAIVATVMTAGAMLPQCFSSLGAMMSAGAAALTTNVGIALVAGAIGSIASQAVGMALGVQESFSWKNVALSAIGAGVTAGLGAGGVTGGVSDALGSAVAGAVLKGTVSQGIAVAVGLQEKFDWKGVAASAVGAALSYGADWGLPKTDTGNAWGGLLRSAAIGMAGGAAQQLVYGGKANWGTVAADAFGNVLGSSVVGGMTAVGNAQQGAALDDAEQLAGDQGNERLYRQGIVPGGGDVGDEIPGMGGYAAGKRRVAGIEIAAKRGDPRNQSARLIYAEDFEVVAPNGRLLHPQHVEGIISDASPDLPQVGDQLVFKEEEHALLGSVVFRDVYGYGNEKWVPRFVLGKDYIKNENDFISGAISLDYPKSTDPHDGRSNRVGTWWAVEVGKANREDIAVQSHKGYLQIWHAMTPDPSLTNMEVRDRILGQMETWWNAGLDSGSLVPIGKLVGHTVFDSFSRSHVARYPNGDIAFFQDYNLQDGHKHGSADGPIFIAVPVAGNNDGWLATQEAIRARKVGRELLQMFKDGRSFGEARAVLIEKVYRFAPGTGDDLSGGTLKEYAKDPKNARPLRNK